MNRLGIIGLGNLAKSFVNFYPHSNELWGTSRNKEKLSESLRERVEVFNYSLGGNWKHLPIKDTKDLVFTIPPTKIDDYVNLNKQFFQSILELNPSMRLIFISSTSVYGDHNQKVDETSSLRPKTANAKKLVEIEEFLLDYNAWILRCGGLISDSRHPIYYLVKKSSIPKPHAAVNLIHEHDVIRFISMLIKEDSKFGVYNLVCPQHPERKEYYNEVAGRLRLNQPDFDESDLRKGKIVVPKKAIETNFTFDYTSPYEMPLVIK